MGRLTILRCNVQEDGIFYSKSILKRGFVCDKQYSGSVPRSELTQGILIRNLDSGSVLNIIYRLRMCARTVGSALISPYLWVLKSSCSQSNC